MPFHSCQMNSDPVSWVSKYAAAIPSGRVLDLACGAGRHGRLFLKAGYQVTFLDRDISRLADLENCQAAKLMQYDLEDGSGWPFQSREFSGIVVINYLHRPLLKHLADALEPGGVLIYQTFAKGNETYGRPRNPDFLLRPDELLNTYKEQLEIVDFEQGYKPNPDRVMQSLRAIKR